MSAAKGESPFIAIIDDENAMRSSLVDLMQSAGYRATAFATAEAFLDSVERSSASCVVTDIQLPGIDGFDLKRQLDDEGSVTPVIMITARIDQFSEDQVKLSGAFCFLRKPFEASALLECVEKSLTP